MTPSSIELIYAGQVHSRQLCCGASLPIEGYTPAGTLPPQEVVRWWSSSFVVRSFC